MRTRATMTPVTDAAVRLTGCVDSAVHRLRMRLRLRQIRHDPVRSERLRKALASTETGEPTNLWSGDELEDFLATREAEPIARELGH